MIEALIIYLAIGLLLAVWCQSDPRMDRTTFLLIMFFWIVAVPLVVHAVIEEWHNRK
jgi:hypothetical protein